MIKIIIQMENGCIKIEKIKEENRVKLELGKKNKSVEAMVI